MPYDLKGRNVLITGGSRGLGEVLAITFAKEGCNIAINYFNRIEAADEVKATCEGFGVKAVVVKGDACLTSECVRSVEEAKEKLGGLDIVIANAGWTKFTTFGDLDAMNEDEWDKCWSANVKGPLALLKAAKPTFNSNPDGGILLITSSIAAVSQGGSSMAYAVTKAAQVQLMKCLASTQGPKIRINAVLPGLLLTEWGLRYPPEVIEAVKAKAALGCAVDLQDCADVFVMLAKNTSMTGMKVQIDGGANIQGS
ncbi:short chain dehydrogenase/reductase [Lindgomyces ingoldianus]|uniref:Short chain dehydrogenase/reductase n=1 Tax=Lindgomyces ingoldianus TaxID=673940 RepID=A0ACB6QYJ0_9PLEO|nr:short chain dehydrogenase/reductase [Lindgomyces ingoldianus]KAF2471595.1 short chain dehydrogenase/reductase [Lindgomyces ingoldianus]